MKLDPWSDCITLDKLTLVKKLVRAFTTFLVEIFCNGIASENLDDTHMTVNKYLLPDLVLKNGPMQFIIMQLKGSSKAGTGCKGVGGILSFGFIDI